MTQLQTPRITLRSWKDEDAEPLAQLNADPEAMRYFPATLSRAESDAMLEKMRTHFEKHRFGFWVAECRATQEFLGFVGLNIPGFEAHFTPCVEIGWRLNQRHWNQGFASEGAAACLEFAFGVLGFQEVVAFTARQNRSSQKLMERIGMHHDPKDDFEHPQLPVGHGLRSHVLYRIRGNPKIKANPILLWTVPT